MVGSQTLGLKSMLMSFSLLKPQKFSLEQKFSLDHTFILESMHIAMRRMDHHEKTERTKKSMEVTIETEKKG
jgi:hypothetical protein